MNANGIFVLCTLAWTASPVSAHLASTVGASSIALATPGPAEWFATVVHEIRRGGFPGDFAPPQLYGGSVYRDFPVALSEVGAIYGVLGPPDERFVSLPGGPGVTGTAFKGAYVDIGFGVVFGPNTLLKIYEVGNDHERAQLFLWTNAGGNTQEFL